MYKHPSKDHSGDYELYTEIISQQILPAGYLAATASLFVNDRFIDATTVREVWTENIFSQYAAQGALLRKAFLEQCSRPMRGLCEIP
jgi:hypothetical protein